MSDKNISWIQTEEENEYLRAAAFSSVGTREYQQDYAGAVIGRDTMLAVICDGMGGLSGGAQASETAVMWLLDDYQNGEKEAEASDFLCWAATQMDRQVAGLKDPAGGRLEAGSTAVSVLIDQDNLYWMSVGDSSIYILRDGVLEPVVRPHNYRRELEDLFGQGEISKEYFETEVSSKKADALTNYLGMDGIRHVERNLQPLLLAPGDQILLCSDGLYKSLDDEQIKTILADNQDDPSNAVKQLVNAALAQAKRGQDNTTAILIQYYGRPKGEGQSMSRCFSCMKEFPDGFDICPHCGYDQTSAAKNLYYLSPGAELSGGRYEIGEAISAGGFGIVYKAWDKTFDKMVAIKEYYPGVIAARTPGTSAVLIYSEKRKAEFERGKERFLSEARKVAKFNNHLNIVDVYDYFEANNTAYMVMEYMDGMTCKEYIRQQGGKLAPGLAVNITLAVLDALQVVHKEKIIHRDINPSNIFICRDGVVKLFDFGAARIEATEMSTILTPHYAPPEQYSINGNQGPFTDIYSVGATLYIMLTGVKPEESTDRVTEDHLIAPSELSADIPEHVSNAVVRAMAVKEELRFQDTGQFRDALMNKGNVRNVAQEIKRRKTRRLLQIAAAFGMMLVVGIICVMTVRRNQDRTRLPDVTIEMWVMADSTDQPEETTAMFESMLTNFYQHYDNVTVQIKAFTKEEYEPALLEALAGNTLPEIFDSTVLPESALVQTEPLEETYSRIGSLDQYYFLDQYQVLYPERKQMPLCVQFPVIYVTALNQEDIVTAKPQWPDIENSLYTINEDDLSLYREMMGSACIEQYHKLMDQYHWESSAAGYHLLRDGETVYYLSDTKDYRKMSQEMAGYYDVAVPGADTYPVRFDYLFSVNSSAGKNEKKAAQWLIYYLLSDTAQDVLTIQHAKGVPLNKRMCNDFADVNSSDFADIGILMEQVTLTGSTTVSQNK